MTDELRNKILAYNRRIKADRMERDELETRVNSLKIKIQDQKAKEKDLQDKVSDMKEALDLLGVRSEEHTSELQSLMQPDLVCRLLLEKKKKKK